MKKSEKIENLKKILTHLEWQCTDLQVIIKSLEITPPELVKEIINRVADEKLYTIQKHLMMIICQMDHFLDHLDDKKKG